MSNSGQYPKSRWKFVLLICEVVAGFDHFPIPLIKIRKEDIRLRYCVHQSQINAVSEWQGLAEYLASTGDIGFCFSALLGDGQGRFQGGGDQAAFCRVMRIARDDDHRPAGKRPADRLVRFPPHDQVVTHGQALETLQVGREVPGQATFDADAVLLIHGDDD